MPNKIDHKKLPRRLDKRVKLTEEDRYRIKVLHFEAGMTIRDVARQFADKCTRRAIQFVLFPERYERVKENNKARQPWKAYSTKYRTEATRRHRQRKAKLRAVGSLTLDYWAKVLSPTRARKKLPPVVYWFATQELADKFARRKAYTRKGWAADFGVFKRELLGGIFLYRGGYHG